MSSSNLINCVKLSRYFFLFSNDVANIIKFPIIKKTIGKIRILLKMYPNINKKIDIIKEEKKTFVLNTEKTLIECFSNLKKFIFVFPENLFFLT